MAYQDTVCFVAYREVPNSTTGVAPFQLLYGRKPEGPLSILKNTWMAGPEGLQLDTTPVTLYMEKLKKQLEDAAEKAKLISTRENGSSLQFEIYEENL
ncbi:hypothetical protein AVEN_92246-1 [Araneus ventricosus]|uniref:Uncharacterized protein n=1 Tax=Araneus ventricosus TaxID=182803 RepID=A0A4Y2AKE6_ARAVE|nr:hypothetical protein AVEN_92246-1 [Araneus ventricosus]